MKLFHEEVLDVQDEDLRKNSLFSLKAGPSNDEPEEDEDLEYSDDDLGENTEITPLGDDIDEDDLKSIYINGPLNDDDDPLSDDDDDWDSEPDLETVEDEDEIVDITPSLQNDPDDDDEDDDLISDDDDDDLLSDDDDPIPGDETFDESNWEEEDDDVEDDDSVAQADDDDVPTSSTDAPQMLDTNSGVESRKEGARAGRMLGHEPGLNTYDGEV